MHESHDVVIVGTGFAGIAMAIRLQQEGFRDFVLLEAADRVGGTWRDNTYPGCACDVPSHLYSYSFEQNPGWSRTFSPHDEILAYIERCVDKHDLRGRIRLGAAVERAAFDEAAGRWTVETRDGRKLSARALVSGTGGLSRPQLPDIPGLGSFAGKAFHSARWDHDYDLAGKRVAVIGTGASAIQIVPAIQPKVAQLAVFQRTPPWVQPKPDYAVPGALKAVFERAPITQKALRDGLYWLLEGLALGFVVDPRLMRPREKMALRYLAESVPDPVLRETLTPRYSMGCKRVLFTNDWYPALQRPNVELVTQGIEAITPAGVRTRDGAVRPFDAIVLATGFLAAEACAPFEVRGRDGRDLRAEWRDSAQAYLGTTVSGFPNLFTLIGPNTGLGHTSMIVMMEAQVEYVIDALRTMNRRGLKLVDVRRDVQEAYNAELQARLRRSVWNSGCQSWYLTRDGKNTTVWPGFTFEFRRRTARFDPESYELVAAAAAPRRAAGSLPVVS